MSKSSPFVRLVKSSNSRILLFIKINFDFLKGTPIQNTMAELWSLLHFVMPTLFDNHEEFDDWFSKDIESRLVVRYCLFFQLFVDFTLKKQFHNSFYISVLKASLKWMKNKSQDFIPYSNLLCYVESKKMLKMN